MRVEVSASLVKANLNVRAVRVGLPSSFVGGGQTAGELLVSALGGLELAGHACKPLALIFAERTQLGAQGRSFVRLQLHPGQRHEELVRLFLLLRVDGRRFGELGLHLLLFIHDPLPVSPLLGDGGSRYSGGPLEGEAVCGGRLQLR